jgi:hypothetical protein
MGGQLIKLGTAAVLAGTVTKLFGTTLEYWCRYGSYCRVPLLSGLGGAVASKFNQNVSSRFGGLKVEVAFLGASVSSPTASTNNNH